MFACRRLSVINELSEGILFCPRDCCRYLAMDPENMHTFTSQPQSEHKQGSAVVLRTQEGINQ